MYNFIIKSIGIDIVECNVVVGVCMTENEFFTYQEYMRKDQELLSPSAEDYLEMIYRLSKDTGYTRVNDLASALNVQPPSVTKMIKKLAELNFIKYEKYGVIVLEPSGISKGQFLLKRHNLIESFLKILHINYKLLEETEIMEHAVSEDIVVGLLDLVEFFREHPQVMEQFNQYRIDKNIDVK